MLWFQKLTLFENRSTKLVHYFWTPINILAARTIFSKKHFDYSDEVLRGQIAIPAHLLVAYIFDNLPILAKYHNIGPLQNVIT